MTASKKPSPRNDPNYLLGATLIEVESSGGSNRVPLRENATVRLRDGKSAKVSVTRIESQARWARQRGDLSAYAELNRLLAETRTKIADVVDVRAVQES